VFLECHKDKQKQYVSFTTSKCWMVPICTYPAKVECFAKIEIWKKRKIALLHALLINLISVVEVVLVLCQ